jgi:hypothetical protein
VLDPIVPNEPVAVPLIDAEYDTHAASAPPAHASLSCRPLKKSSTTDKKSSGRT